MTACYATHRRDAIHRLGDRYDCCCHPEIMQALIFALNDSDERVRAKAADEIGDQIRRNRCICGPSVICALKTSMADCDRGVRRQAEEALQLSGYRIVNDCCQTNCCSASCLTVPQNAVTPSENADSTIPEVPDSPTDSATLPAENLPPATVPTEEAPAPPAVIEEQSQSYFPSQLHEKYEQPEVTGLSRFFSSLSGREGTGN